MVNKGPDPNFKNCYQIRRVLLEARGGIEPPNKGFADLFNSPINGYVLNTKCPEMVVLGQV